MNCTIRNGPQCVRNLIVLPQQKTSISLGLHIALRHFYGKENFPPCVHGELGSAYWANLEVATEPGEALSSPRDRISAEDTPLGRASTLNSA